MRFVTVGASVAFVTLLVRTAWLDDDAYITFRTVDNFLNGFGLRWNVSNRVQAYTNPLWMFAMAGVSAVTGEVYYSSILLSMVVSTVVIALVLSRVASSWLTALFAVSTLVLSKAYVDYSTSGLENPLTHLLLVGWCIVVASSVSEARRLLLLALLAALLMLNRLDTGLLVLPALAVAWWRVGPTRGARLLLIGMLPLVAWELFSVVYYGFPFPNTAYSKLQHGVPRPEILHQGFLYLLDSLANDPLTLLVIAGGILAPIVSGGGRTVSSGIVLYLAYVVWVGGDFMSGRFLTGPLLLAVMELARRDLAASPVAAGLALGLVWLVGLTAPRPTIVSNAAYGSDIEPARVIAPTGITDERRYYYPQSGLLNARRGVSMPNHKWLQMGYEAKARGDRVLTTDAAGFIGYAAGPSVHFVDRYGLGDPLLARLPAETPWRIGHFVRRVPDGYLESLEAGRNVIRDRGVAAYYERLQMITEGPLWTRERFRTILRMNLGRYQRYIEAYGLIRVRLADVVIVKPDGTDWNRADNQVMTLRGVEVALPEATDAAALELSLSRNDNYRLVLLHAGREVDEHRIAQAMAVDSSLTTYVVPLPGDVTFDAVLVQPSGGDARYSLGHLRLAPAR